MARPIAHLPGIIIRLGLAFFVIVTSVTLSGCGNQMFRQESYSPLDTPRAVAPIQSVPVSLSKAPGDASPIYSPAFGDEQASRTGTISGSATAAEPDLPPANLSDNARNLPVPPIVDRLSSPYSLDDKEFVLSGHIMFLNRCVQCHNSGGYGYGAVGSYLIPHPPDLASAIVQKRSDGALFWVITKGQGKMPGLQNWTTPTERWALTAFVRSLKGSKPSDANLLGDHVSNTTSSPYPVYGEVGFEHGRNSAPNKELGGAPSPAESRVYTDNTEPQELISRSPQ